MKRVFAYMLSWLIVMLLPCCWCGAQDKTYSPPPMTTNCFDYSKDAVTWKPYYYNGDTIRNLEYVTVRYMFGKNKKYYRVRYILIRSNWYYYPNHEPIHIINYKVKGYPEVIVKQ